MNRAIVQRTSWTLTVLVGAFFVWAIPAKLQQGNVEMKPVPATVVGIAPVPDGYHAMVRVTARTPDGRYGSRFVGLQNLGCKVGDTVDGRSRG